MEIIVRNKMEEKIKEHQQKYGTTKAWIANQMGISPQHLNKSFQSNNPTIEILLRLSIVLNCNIFDLFEYEVIK